MRIVNATFVSFSCCGKPNEDGQCYIKGTDALIQNLIDFLAFLVDLKERNLSFDTYYISIPMAEWLLEKKLTFTGTLQGYRKGVPIDIKAVKQREVLSFKIYREKENNVMTISSYVVKTSKGIKNVLILSTHGPILGITKDYG